MTDGESGELRQLVEQACGGDTLALGTLLDQHRPYLRIVARRAMKQLFQNKFDESDAVQQTCLEAHECIRDFRGEGDVAFTAWLTRILKNNIANLQRDQTTQKRDVRRERSIEDDHDASLVWISPQANESGPVTKIIKGEAALILAKALSEVRQRQRIAVQMRFLEGCKLSEIASHLDVSIPSAAGLIDRGLEALRELLPTEFQSI